MFLLEFLKLVSGQLENILSKGHFLFSRIFIHLLSLPFSLFFFPCIFCCVLPPRDFDIKPHSTFSNWMLSCLSFCSCRMHLTSSAQIVNFTTKPSYRQPIYKFTPLFSLVHGLKPFSRFGTRLNSHSWLFFSTSSKCRKTPAKLVSQLLAVFAAVQKISWLSTWPVVVLVWHRCLAALCREHPTWGPCRSQPGLNETAGNVSCYCIKIQTRRIKCFYSHHWKNQECEPEEIAGRAENIFHPEAWELWATTGAFLQVVSKES